MTDDGYAAYLAAREESEKQASILAAKDDMSDAFGEVQGGYASYLGHITSLEAVKEYGIMRLDETYAMGIDSGLSPEDAATVSANVYRVLRGDVYDRCLTAARNSYMDEAGLRSYAERAGLLPEDIDKLIYEARFNLVRN